MTVGELITLIIVFFIAGMLAENVKHKRIFLSAALAASGGGLMETALLRGGLEGLPAALGGMGFGFLLYIAAMDALGVRFPRLESV